MVRRLTRVEAEAIAVIHPGTLPWRRPGNEYTPRSSERFDLKEIIILRRLMQGETGRQIAKSTGIANANHIIKSMMKRHDVETRDELLALEQVQEVLNEGL